MATLAYPALLAGCVVRVSRANRAARAAAPLILEAGNGWEPGQVSVAVRSSPRSLVAMVAGLALLAAACGADSGESAATASDPTAATSTAATSTAASAVDSPSSAAAPEVAPASGPFTGAHTTLDGSTIDFDQFAGQDVVLWFWAPW